MVDEDEVVLVGVELVLEELELVGELVELEVSLVELDVSLLEELDRLALAHSPATWLSRSLSPSEIRWRSALSTVRGRAW